MKLAIKFINFFTKDLRENIFVLLSFPRLFKLRKTSHNIEAQVATIIFSKDRPLQLEALLNSYFHYCVNALPPIVIYNAVDDKYKNAYLKLFSQFSDRGVVALDDSKGFKDCLMYALELIETKQFFFLVDDIIFKKTFNPNKFLNLGTHFIPSMRMGLHLNKCYTQLKPQPLPDFRNDGDLYFWKYGKGILDWAYPLSVDGHIFYKEEIKLMTKVLSFKAPNSYESKLQKFRLLYRRLYGACYNESVIMNIPCNKVQSENENHAGDWHQDDLLDLFWTKKINFLAYENFINESCHQEVALSFKDRL